MNQEKPGRMKEMQGIAEAAEMTRARAVLHETDDLTLEDMIRLTSIAAPPFAETRRGEWMASRFAETGLQNVRTDDIGNVLADRAGESGEPLLLVAHLDTVFPAETTIAVRRSGSRIAAPGISDNGRGLAALLSLARALDTADVRLGRPLTFVASVGEEGVGDLRGVKHLFEDRRWHDAAGFIAVDGAGHRRIVHRAVGARRLRCLFGGPGGHSWADWGRVNPIHTAGAAAAELSRLVLPRAPRTTLTVGRIGGGTSVNAIPEAAWLELDLRSEGADALQDLEARARTTIKAAVRDANRRRPRGTAPMALEIELMGSRPAGCTAEDDVLVRAAQQATRYLGEVPELASSSTDANVPMSLGIPAIALGAGGDSGGAHTLDEWYDNTGGVIGLERLLLTVAAVAGLA